MRNPAPISLATVKAVSDVAMRAVTPKADSSRNSVAWVRIASTPGSARRKPSVMPLVMQLTAFGPGVVTKTAQKSAKTTQASRLIPGLPPSSGT